MNKLTILLITALISFNLTLTAQEVKFGKVSKQELQEKVYPLDSTASAAILYKKRTSHFEYTDGEGFTLITKVHKRIKIYTKEGLEWAKETVPAFQTHGSRETVGIKAYTFNLEKGKIIKEKLKSKSIFKEKESENWTNFKFTMPNARAGSIVEWQYTITSPFASNINDVIFQYKIPVKKVDVKISIPQYYTFKYLPTFYYPIHVQTSKENRTLSWSYRTVDGAGRAVSTNHNTSKNIYETVYKSIESNIPAIKEEPLINNLNNYVAKIHFELASRQFPNTEVKFYTNTWEDVAKTIFKSYSFGKQLQGTGFLKTAVTSEISDAKTDQEKALRLFQFIKTQFFSA